MSDVKVAEILKLSVEEKLRLVEAIWESIAAAPGDLPLDDAHRAAIDEELADHTRNPDDVLNLNQLLAEIRRVQ